MDNAKIYPDMCCYNRPYDDISLAQEPFDYTEWRRDNLSDDISVSELTRQATEYWNSVQKETAILVKRKIV